MDCRKQYIADALLRADTCCVERGFTLHVKGLVTTRDELLNGTDVHELISRTFGAAPCQNINNEDRFARHRTYSQSGHGRSSGGPAIAAAHVLGEARAWHGLACSRLLLQILPRALHVSLPSFFSHAPLVTMRVFFVLSTSIPSCSLGSPPTYCRFRDDFEDRSK